VTDRLTPTDGEAARPAARWEDYVDVFFSPAELFRRRARDSVVPPLITLLTLAVLFYLLLLPANAMITRAAMASNPRGVVLSGNTMLVIQLVGAVAVPVSYVAFIVFAAALLWLVGRFAEIRTDFSRTLLIATYGGFILLLSQLVAGALILLHGEAGLDPIRHLSLGVLRITGAEGIGRALVPLLRRLDVFAIWQAALWAVGLHAIYRTTRSQAAIVAAVSWLLFAVPGLIMAALGMGQPPQS
jgi:hypothetical protein